MAQYQRIFAALDGASTQKAVAQRAVALAADNGARLLFGHVVDSVPNEANGADYEAPVSYTHLDVYKRQLWLTLTL